VQQQRQQNTGFTPAGQGHALRILPPPPQHQGSIPSGRAPGLQGATTVAGPGAETKYSNNKKEDNVPLLQRQSMLKAKLQADVAASRNGGNGGGAGVQSVNITDIGNAFGGM